MNNNHINLPKDLIQCENDLFLSLTNFLKSENDNRICINLKFEGLKLQPPIFRLANNLVRDLSRCRILFADFGSAALAKRDYPTFSENIETFKEYIVSVKSSKDDLILSFKS